MQETESFWSSSINPTSSSLPKAILKKQAMELGIVTKNIVEANVNTKMIVDKSDGFTDPPSYLHCFDILAPILGFQSFTLFCVKQSLTSEYPLSFYSDYWDKEGWCNCENVHEFNKCLQNILSSDKTTELINSVIAQSI